jgi:hypothetical protein
MLRPYMVDAYGKPVAAQWITPHWKLIPLPIRLQFRSSRVAPNATLRIKPSEVAPLISLTQKARASLSLKHPQPQY